MKKIFPYYSQADRYFKYHNCLQIVSSEKQSFSFEKPNGIKMILLTCNEVTEVH